MPCPDTLIHADCLEAMKHIADGSIDAIICDLPYALTGNRWDTLIPFDLLWETYRRVIKPNGAIVLFGSQPFTSALIMSNPQWFKYEWIWEKSKASNYLNARRCPLKAHENICVFCQGTPVYNAQIGTGKPYKNSHIPGDKGSCYGGGAIKEYSFDNPGTRFPRSVFPRSMFDNEWKPVHPTQKPVALLEYLVRTYTNPGDLVLDNCMGSATLPVACIRTGRHFIGIEKDDVYFAASVERVRAALAQQAFAFDAPPV